MSGGTMIERLVLVRHGDAEFYGPDGTDLSRRLTVDGAEALREAYPDIFSRLASEQEVTFWVSPAVRAYETAEIAAEVLDIDPEDFSTRESLYEQDDDMFQMELYAEGEGCVVAVGHVPFMHRFLWELTGEDIAFGKGSVACVTFDDGDVSHAKLEWFAEGPDV